MKLVNWYVVFVRVFIAFLELKLVKIQNKFKNTKLTLLIKMVNESQIINNILIAVKIYFYEPKL